MRVEVEDAGRAGIGDQRLQRRRIEDARLLERHLLRFRSGGRRKVVINYRAERSGLHFIDVFARRGGEARYAALGPVLPESFALLTLVRLMMASAVLIGVAQVQMGASWRVGVPAEGPGALVKHGLDPAPGGRERLVRDDVRVGRPVPVRPSYRVRS